MRTLSADARFAWSLMPPDCTTSLARLKRSAHWDTARPAILLEAEKGLKLIGKYSVLDVMASLELAAEHWLQDHQVAHDTQMTRNDTSKLGQVAPRCAP